MKFLSLKEQLAIAEIIVGILALCNYFLIDIYDEKLQDVDLFKHQCINLSLCFISFFYAFGTWFWFSNIRMTRILNRLHIVLVYIILNILIFYTHFCYMSNYGPSIRGHFDHGIFFDEDERMTNNFYILLCILVLSTIIISSHMRYIVIRVLQMKNN